VKHLRLWLAAAATMVTAAPGASAQTASAQPRVIPEGMVGNDRAFTTVRELWHSKELDVDVQVKRTDPRWGTRTATMTEINLGEPDASFFQIPEGYRVEKGPNRISPQPQVEPFAPQNQ